MITYLVSSYKSNSVKVKLYLIILIIKYLIILWFHVGFVVDIWI